MKFRRRPAHRRAERHRLLGFMVAMLCVSCPGPPVHQDPRPIVVIGVDGAEWKVIRRLWEEGRLPNLKALAARGPTATLRTAYEMSPVIWTTIATGVAPRTHGILDFVVPTERGEVLVSSTVRRVPALWNMATAADRRVAVVGWWATWPAEPVNGVVITDRVLRDLENRFYPPEMAERVAAGLKDAEHPPSSFRGLVIGEARDRVVSRFATELVTEGFDLLLVYFRSTDTASHFYWKYFELEHFSGVTAEEIAEKGDLIGRAYDAFDDALGNMVAAAPPQTNFLVISDHGFQAAQEEEITVVFDLDEVLEELEYLVRDEDGIDFAASRVFTYGSRPNLGVKMVRFSLAGREPRGRVKPEQRESLMSDLRRDLAGVRYTTGEPALRVRAANESESRRGADFVVEILTAGATTGLVVAERPFSGAISRIRRVSGTHSSQTHGVILAAGPDIDPAADLEGISIKDMAPTILYGMGLPVADDFVGQARQELFTADFRRDHPLQTIPTWGARAPGQPTASAIDEDLIDELRALGYLK